MKALRRGRVLARILRHQPAPLGNDQGFRRADGRWIELADFARALLIDDATIADADEMQSFSPQGRDR